MINGENKRKLLFDIILVVSLLAIALSAFLIYKFVLDDRSEPTENSLVVIRIENEIVYSGSLYEDAEIEVGGTNVVLISGGRVRMKSSNCRGYQDCVEAGEIYLVGDRIICLPNRVSVYIEEGAKK